MRCLKDKGYLYLTLDNCEASTLVWAAFKEDETLNRTELAELILIPCEGCNVARRR